MATIRQVSVFVENTSGRLAEVTRTLADEKINLRAISVADTADFGILRIIVDDPERAARTLEQSGFTAKITEVVGVEVPDRPGGLADVMDVFNKEKVNIEYLYTSLEHTRQNAVMIFKVADLQLGLKICEQHGFAVVSSF